MEGSEGRSNVRTSLHHAHVHSSTVNLLPGPSSQGEWKDAGSALLHFAAAVVALHQLPFGTTLASDALNQNQLRLVPAAERLHWESAFASH